MTTFAMGYLRSLYLAVINFFLLTDDCPPIPFIRHRNNHKHLAIASDMVINPIISMNRQSNFKMLGLN
ncbi:MAG: hypothetical protein ACOYN8_11315 [Pseudanabaena sp.]